MKRRAAARVSGALALSLIGPGCAVGPSFKPPLSPATQTYPGVESPADTEPADRLGGEMQRFSVAGDVPGRWWTLFGSAALSRLIDEALAKYPDIASQQAALRSARENVRVERGGLLPQIRGTVNGTREQVSGGSIGPGSPQYLTNLYQANVAVSYTLDVFGGERRAIEGAQARALAQRFRLEASYLTLTAGVASTAIQLAAAREQIAATQDIIALEEKQLGIIERRFELGSHTRADVLQEEANLASVRATLPVLQQQLAAAEHRLALLTGQFPHEAARIDLDLSDLTLPRELPVSLPSALLAQRPDIKMQEMMMRQASAAIGVATANMLPQLTLSGAYGGESLVWASLLAPGSNAWSVVGGLTQPLFEGGTLRAKRRAALDDYDQASAQYQLVVLEAFQNVADTLTALEQDAHALKFQHDAVTAAAASLDLVRNQYHAGAVDFIPLLVAQQGYQQARIAEVRAVASRYSDTVALFQALGGGWWNRNDP